MIAAPTKWPRPTIAPGVAIGDAFVRLCGAALAQIAANAPGVARGADPEYLHQLRVGVRRLLSAMRTFRPLLKRKRAKAIAQELRDAMQVFGASRDWDVCVLTLERADASEALASSAARQRVGASLPARALAGSAEFLAVQNRVRRWLDEGPWRSSAEPGERVLGYARRALERAHAKLDQRAEGIDWTDRRERHRVRIALKRLRYGGDFFADCFPAGAVGPFLKRLGKLQDTLGELNDLAVAHTLLAELHGDRQHVRRWLAHRERRLIALLSREWMAFARMHPYWRAEGPRAARRTPRASASRA